MEPYYLKQFTKIIKGKEFTKSNASEYGQSEDVQMIIKDGK